MQTGSDDMYINMTDASTGALVESFSGHSSWVLSLDIHPDGSTLVSGGADNKVKLWDLQTRSCTQTSSEHSDHVWGTKFSRDGAYLATVGACGSAAVYTTA